MPFKIIQTIESGEICLTVVPSGWETNGILRWPKKHLVGKLSQIEGSIPDENWEKMICVKKREFKTRKQADDELERMETQPDTEVEDIPRPPPKKRIRQEERTNKAYKAKDFNRLVEQNMEPEQSHAEISAESDAVVSCLNSLVFLCKYVLFSISFID